MEEPSKRKQFCVKKWPLEKKNIPSTKNVVHQALVDKAKIYLPLLHIKLGLIKHFVKTMNKDGEGFEYMKHKFPRMSKAKIKKVFLLDLNKTTISRFYFQK